jgi:hypothetical protein
MKPPAPAERVADRECVRESAGPWTAECSAHWVRRIARRAGYRVAESTGGAWIVAGGRHGFFIWATETSASPEVVAEHGGFRLVGRVAGVPVYDDSVRTFWPASGFLLWVEAGPRADSVAPKPGELGPLIRASRAVPPPP